MNLIHTPASQLEFESNMASSTERERQIARLLQRAGGHPMEEILPLYLRQALSLTRNDGLRAQLEELLK